MDLSGIGAIAAAVIALGALWVTLLARRDSKTAAEAAAVSARAAEAALALERDEVARALEVSDVAWEIRSSRRGGVEFVNTGSSVARDVTIALQVGRKREDFSMAAVAPGGVVKAPPSFAAVQVRSDHGVQVALVPHGEGGVARAGISARVAWRSELGTPGNQQF